MLLEELSDPVALETVKLARSEVSRVVNGTDDRLLVVVNQRPYCPPPLRLADFRLTAHSGNRVAPRRLRRSAPLHPRAAVTRRGVERAGGPMLDP